MLQTDRATKPTLKGFAMQVRTLSTLGVHNDAGGQRVVAWPACGRGDGRDGSRASMDRQLRLTATHGAVLSLAATSRYPGNADDSYLVKHNAVVIWTGGGDVPVIVNGRQGTSFETLTPLGSVSV